MKPADFDNVVKEALSLMDTDTVDNFAHSDFFDVVNDTVFDYAKAKESITNYINNHNTEQNGVRGSIMTYKQHDLQYPQSAQLFNASNYETKKLSDDAVAVILNLYKSLLPEDSEAISAKLLPVIAEFYEISLQKNVVRLNKKYDLDVRQFYTTLIYDSLFKFTLMSDKITKATWVKQMVELVYSYSDTKSYLSYYQVYPDQQGNYKYAEWLKKKSPALPVRALEIYDTIINKVTDINRSSSIKKDIVDEDYSKWFVGTNVLEGHVQCQEIEKEVQNT